MKDKIELVEKRIKELKQSIEFNENSQDVRSMTALLAVNEQMLLLLKADIPPTFFVDPNKQSHGFFLPITAQMIEPFLMIMN